MLQFTVGTYSECYVFQFTNDSFQATPQVPVMEFGRRLALERELAKSDKMSLCNLVWDDSGNFLLYATLLGVKGLRHCISMFSVALKSIVMTAVAVADVQ